MENEALHILREQKYTAALFLSIEELSPGQEPAALDSTSFELMDFCQGAVAKEELEFFLKIAKRESSFQEEAKKQGIGPAACYKRFERIRKKLNHDQYAYLRQLPMGKLLELLDIAPVPASCPEDAAYVDALEEAIIEKEKENPTGFLPDIDQQWEQFVTRYLPDAEEAVLEPDAVSAQTDQGPQKRVVRLGRVWRTALVAAAAVACMLAVMVTVQAAGVDIFGAMARWSEDIFSFGQIAPGSQVYDDLPRETVGQEMEAPGSGAEFASLQEAFDAYGITEVHEPAWLPDGYVLDTLDVLCLDDPFLRTFHASYTDGENPVGISIMSYEGEPNAQVQKIGGPVESVEKNGVTFYHIENSVGRTIAWYSNQYEYYLCGDAEDDILWRIADSMFE